MTAQKVRCDYEEMQRLAKEFSQHSNNLHTATQRLKAAQETLRGGEWIGKGATAFYAEMDSAVLPAQQRLIKALDNAGRVVQQISGLINTAETDAAGVFKLDNVGSGLGAGLGAVGAAVEDTASQVAADSSGADNSGADSGLESSPDSGLPDSAATPPIWEGNCLPPAVAVEQLTQGDPAQVETPVAPKKKKLFFGRIIEGVKKAVTWVKDKALPFIKDKIVPLVKKAIPIVGQVIEVGKEVFSWFKKK